MRNIFMGTIIEYCHRRTFQCEKRANRKVDKEKDGQEKLRERILLKK